MARSKSRTEREDAVDPVETDKHPAACEDHEVFVGGRPEGEDGSNPVLVQSKVEGELSVVPEDMDTEEKVDQFEQEKVIPPAPAEDGAVNDTGDALRADQAPERQRLGVNNNPLAADEDAEPTATLSEEQREQYAKTQFEAAETNRAVVNAIREYKEARDGRAG